MGADRTPGHSFVLDFRAALALEVLAKDASAAMVGKGIEVGKGTVTGIASGIAESRKNAESADGAVVVATNFGNVRGRPGGEAFMNHNGALKYLSGHIVQAAQQDVAAHTHHAMLGAKRGAEHRARVNREILDECADRWAARLSGDGAYEVQLALALLLHKHGWDGGPFGRAWRAAADRLADELPEGFARALPKIEALLAAPPVPLARKPALPPSTTQFRAGDLIAITIRGRTFAAFVYEVVREGSGAQYPVVEFFDRTFPAVPSAEALAGVAAAGERFQDGAVRRSLHGVSGLTWQPDPAGQVVLLQAQSAIRPSAEALAPPVGLHAFNWFHRLPQVVEQLLGPAAAAPR